MGQNLLKSARFENFGIFIFTWFKKTTTLSYNVLKKNLVKMKVSENKKIILMQNLLYSNVIIIACGRQKLDNEQYTTRPQQMQL